MYYIFDFDSTFIKTEGLEELATLALEGRSDKDEIIKKITDVTNRGMNGELDFAQSLSDRLDLMVVNKEHINQLAELLKSKVSESFKSNRQFFKDNCESIYIFSGGFKDFITPTLLDFGIKKENIFANVFLYNKEDEVVGFDKDNFLAQTGGKAKQLESLDLKDEICVIGDGWSDYEMKQSGLADCFVAFTENIRRKKVVAVSDRAIDSLDDLLF